MCHVPWGTMWNMIGQRDAVHALAQGVEHDHLSHALLLTGGAGWGKTTLALQLAKVLNCTGENPPCGHCVHCRQIAGGSHPDVSIVERADGKDSVAIAQIRALRTEASLKPYQGSHKVYIIAGAESLTLQASDALLKTLEEPQPYVTIVLTATDPDTLPATILSRCRIVPLHQIGAAELAAALMARGITETDARDAARLARGNVGWALQAAKLPKQIAQRREMLERLVAVPDMELEDRLTLAESIVAEKKDKSNVRRQVEVLMLLARDLLLVSQGLPPQTALDDHHAMLQRQAQRLGLRGIDKHVQAIRTCMVRIDANVDPRLALEAALVGAP